MVVPRHVPYQVRDIPEDGCGINMISKVLQDDDQLFRNVCQADIAILNTEGCVCQVIVEESAVEFVAVIVEIPVVIGSNIWYAAGCDV